MKWPNFWEEGVVVGCHLVAGCTSLPDWNDRQKPRAVAMLRRTSNCRKLLRCIMLLAVVIVEEWQCRSTVANEDWNCCGRRAVHHAACGHADDVLVAR